MSFSASSASSMCNFTLFSSLDVGDEFVECAFQFPDVGLNIGSNVLE